MGCSSSSAVEELKSDKIKDTREESNNENIKATSVRKYNNNNNDNNSKNQNENSNNDNVNINTNNEIKVSITDNFKNTKKRRNIQEELKNKIFHCTYCNKVKEIKQEDDDENFTCVDCKNKCPLEENNNFYCDHCNSHLCFDCINKKVEDKSIECHLCKSKNGEEYKFKETNNYRCFYCDAEYENQSSFECEKCGVISCLKCALFNEIKIDEVKCHCGSVLNEMPLLQKGKGNSCSVVGCGDVIDENRLFFKCECAADLCNCLLKMQYTYDN